LDGSVSIESDPAHPKIKRISKVQKKLDALTDAVRRRAIDEAVGLVQTWESEVKPGASDEQRGGRNDLRWP
jgi:hypothetical protein